MFSWIRYAALAFLIGCASSENSQKHTASRRIADQPQMLRVRNRSPQVNDVVREVSRTSLRTVFRGSLQSSSIEDEVTTREVLDVDDNIESKMRVTYELVRERANDSDLLSGKPSKKQRLEGHAYLLRKVGKKVEIIREDGHAIDEDEKELVRKDNQSFGKHSPILDALTKSAVQAGESMPWLAHAMKELIEDGDKKSTKIFRERARLREITFEGAAMVGVFEISMIVVNELNDDGQMVLETLSTVRVRAHDGFGLQLNIEAVGTLFTREGVPKHAGLTIMKSVESRYSMSIK